VGPIIGPTLGGWLTESYNWRWVFLINLPVGIVAVLGCAAYLPQSPRRRRKFDLFGFAMLSLGIWQVQRMGWKSALLQELAAAQAGPPASADNPAPFAHIIASGRFRHDLELLLGSEVRGTTLGAALITPLERDGAPALLVERGWVPLDRAGVTRPEGRVTVQGYMRPSERPGLLSAADSPATRRFHNFDIPAMGAALGLPVAPFGLAVVVPGRARPDGGLGSQLLLQLCHRGVRVHGLLDLAAVRAAYLHPHEHGCLRGQLPAVLQSCAGCCRR
jgi:surfeit locus 1 family protein